MSSFCNMMKLKSISALSKAYNTSAALSIVSQPAVLLVQGYHNVSFQDFGSEKSATVYGGKPVLEPSPQSTSNNEKSSNSQVTVPKARSDRFVSSTNPKFAFTTTRLRRSSLLNRTIASSVQKARNFSVKDDTTPIAKDEVSPTTQTSCNLSEFKSEVETSTPSTAYWNDLSQAITPEITFWYRELCPERIPSGWSNDPMDLDRALAIPVEDCGLDTMACVPILVELAQDDAAIERYLFEIYGRFYFYHRKSEGVFLIMESGYLIDVLDKLADVGAENVETGFIGNIFWEEVE
ncbi:hypothetical protein P7C71_g1874, partial [Lecanoromycetidae sp. Uapishka_2]